MTAATQSRREPKARNVHSQQLKSLSQIPALFGPRTDVVDWRKDPRHAFKSLIRQLDQALDRFRRRIKTQHQF